MDLRSVSFSWLRALFVLALLPLAAPAQDAPYVDPPGRVAQLNFFEGPVSFEPAGYGQWAAAVLNRPLTQGDRVWSGANARSELHVGSTTMQLAAETSLAFTTLDDRTVQLALTQGSVVVRVRELPAGQRFEIDTPNLALNAAQPGNYRVDVDATAGTTTVTVRSGSVQVLGTSAVPLAMPPSEQITFSGNGLTQVAGQTAPLQDAFGYWAAARDDAEDGVAAARYVSRDMVGYQQLDRYGTWQNDPAYGAVWVPSATAADWAPYRYGHWGFIAPWGWTWIDDEPWGFAPFHYGRWTLIDARWCWVPGPIAVRPVYAPALVAFIGGSVGGVHFSISVGGLMQPAVGWFPLAPGEIWRPAFRASPTYVTEVNRTVIVNRNVTNITNITNINRVTDVYRYQDRPQAVTAVSARAFTQGEHLRGNLAPVTTAQLAAVRVMAPPAPTRDPRAIFAASRLTEPHPAPPAAVLERHVVAAPAAARAPQAVSLQRPVAPQAVPATAGRAPLARQPLAGRAEPAPAVPRPPHGSPQLDESARSTARPAPQPLQREQGQREQAQREGFQRERPRGPQEQREQSQREQVQREPAAQTLQRQQGPQALQAPHEHRPEAARGEAPRAQTQRRPLQRQADEESRP